MQLAGYNITLHAMERSMLRGITEQDILSALYSDKKKVTPTLDGIAYRYNDVVVVTVDQTAITTYRASEYRWTYRFWTICDVPLRVEIAPNCISEQFKSLYREWTQYRRKELCASLEERMLAGGLESVAFCSEDSSEKGIQTCTLQEVQTLPNVRVTAWHKVRKGAGGVGASNRGWLDQW